MPAACKTCSEITHLRAIVETVRTISRHRIRIDAAMVKKNSIPGAWIFFYLLWQQYLNDTCLARIYRKPVVVNSFGICLYRNNRNGNVCALCLAMCNVPRTIPIVFTLLLYCGIESLNSSTHTHTTWLFLRAACFFCRIEIFILFLYPLQVLLGFSIATLGIIVCTVWLFASHFSKPFLDGILL